MRLLYLTLDDLSRPGAWRTHVHGVTGALARRGWTVRVVAPGTAQLDLPAGVEGAPAPRPASRVGRLAHAFFGLSRIVSAELERFAPDAVYTRGVNPFPGWNPALASPRPLVVEINGYAEDEASFLLRRRVRSRHVAFFRRAAAVTAVSGKLRRDLLARYGLPPERVFVVANGADLERFGPQSREACRRRRGWERAGPVVLFVGSFYAHHALDALVATAAEVRKARPDARFVLAGEGPERERICELVRARGLEDAVALPGAVPPDEVPSWMGAADVCVLTLCSPRTRERGCSPIKLFEYMACERPVALMVDAREVVEIVHRAGAGRARLATGRLDDDARAFAADILALLADDARARAMAAAGRRAAEAIFNWDRAGRRVAAILDAALGRGSWPDREEAWPTERG